MMKEFLENSVQANQYEKFRPEYFEQWQNGVFWGPFYPKTDIKVHSENSIENEQGAQYGRPVSA